MNGVYRTGCFMTFKRDGDAVGIWRPSQAMIVWLDIDDFQTNTVGSTPMVMSNLKLEVRTSQAPSDHKLS